MNQNKHGRTLFKKEFIDYTSEQSGVPRYKLIEALDAFMESITSALKEGYIIKLTGFGEFTIKRRAASKGRNKNTGEPVDIPPSIKPHFRPGLPLFRAVEDGKKNWDGYPETKEH